MAFSDLTARLEATESVFSQTANSSDLRSKVDGQIILAELQKKVCEYESQGAMLAQYKDLKDCRMALEAKELVINCPHLRLAISHIYCTGNSQSTGRLRSTLFSMGVPERKGRDEAC